MFFVHMSDSLRHDAILAIRPELPTELIRPSISDHERFQNLTLRPIIKFQHNVILELTRHYIVKTNPNFYSISSEKREVYIRKSLAKNASLKHHLVGIVTGQMTVQEFKNFLTNQSEFTKRIGQIITNRIVDSMNELEVKD